VPGGSHEVGDDSAVLANPQSTIVRCLGGLEVRCAGRPMVNWRSGKARAVFEYLVTHRLRPVPRDTLVQAIWPDPDALASGTSLKVAVHALRQILVEGPGNGLPSGLEVIVHEATYLLHAPRLWVDVEEFERCSAIGDRLEVSGQAQAALDVYERAAELYRGDFLAESLDDWVVFRREGLKDQYLHILAKLADARLRVEDYDGCIAVCRKLLEQDNCREDTYRLLMVCHARLGQRGRVRRWFELCVQTLRTLLDTEPEPETYRIYRWASATGEQVRPLTRD
jgi:two-component SAPR family response regulator